MQSEIEPRTGTAALADGRRVIAWAALLLFLALSVALDVGSALPLKLPGHRAFPGALALLVAGELFPPLGLVALAVATPAAILLLDPRHGFAPWPILAWLVPALAWVLMPRKARGTPWAMLAAGLLFGLLRAADGGVHHVPQAWRLAGHLGFGCLGGLAAYALARKRGGR